MVSTTDKIDSIAFPLEGLPGTSSYKFGRQFAAVTKQAFIAETISRGHDSHNREGAIRQGRFRRRADDRISSGYPYGALFAGATTRKPMAWKRYAASW
jgi:hypothetical protein